jgi:hypothetical protein
MRRLLVCSYALLLTCVSYANPYWDPQKVPQDSITISKNLDISQLKTSLNTAGLPVLRIQVDWSERDESYAMTQSVIELSGTQALMNKSTHKPKWGSYLGILKDPISGEERSFDSIGTGKEYRKLARAINLRFPVPASDMIFVLYAENPQTGAMEPVLEQPILVNDLKKETRQFADLEVKLLAEATKTPKLRVNIYAEGYRISDAKQFWQHAMKTVNVLTREHFPGVDHMEFYGVFSPSIKKLGSAENLGFPVPDFDSFLGLYYPYWDNFGRWYHIVYPTRENKFRQGLAAAPYDYPIVLVNSSGYWGVGNYMSHTAIPAANSSYFSYLLLHELGHFFGLNEEYEGGGRTELEFAYGIEEPWSQNSTFLHQSNYSGLKWNQFVNPKTKLPTPDSEWRSSPPVYGAYQGGYADSQHTTGTSYKPGLNCVMEAHETFCAVCTHAIEEVVDYSLGLK